MRQIRVHKKQKRLKRFLLPLWLRCLTTLFLPIYAWSSLPSYCWAAVEIQLDKPTTGTSKSIATPPPKSSAVKAKPNATPPPLPVNLIARDQSSSEPGAPKTKVTFSKDPTDQELFDSAVLAEPPVPMDGKA